jgi:hypothetical protein
MPRVPASKASSGMRSSVAIMAFSWTVNALMGQLPYPWIRAERRPDDG